MILCLKTCKKYGRAVDKRLCSFAIICRTGIYCSKCTQTTLTTATLFNRFRCTEKGILCVKGDSVRMKLVRNGLLIQGGQGNQIKPSLSRVLMLALNSNLSNSISFFVEYFAELKCHFLILLLLYVQVNVIFLIFFY